MQILFQTEHLAQEFSNPNSKLFPDAPGVCPYEACLTKIKLKKHGYYQRFFISKSFCGILYIRSLIYTAARKQSVVDEEAVFQANIETGF